MFISEFLSNTNFCLTLFTILVYLMINYLNKVDHVMNSDRSRLNWFETIWWYRVQNCKQVMNGNQRCYPSFSSPVFVPDLPNGLLIISAKFVFPWMKYTKKKHQKAYLHKKYASRMLRLPAAAFMPIDSCRFFLHMA